MNDSVSGSGANSTIRCAGECLEASKRAFEQAALVANGSISRRNDLDKRFQYLLDVSAYDHHQQAEVLLEHALALYEAEFGQEHPSVAKMLFDLAVLYASHGNFDSAAYLNSWANDILRANRPEPTHEFFHLIGAPPDDVESSPAS